MRTASLLALLALSGCASTDPGQAFLSQELSYVRVGVLPKSEEREVRRVLSQRGLRIVSRIENEFFVALGAAARDGSKSAVRLITGRGVVLADDASSDDLFAPGSISLIEHFGGVQADHVLFAEARIARGLDVGCVTLQRILPDGSIAQCAFDVGSLGPRACVSNLAPGRGGHMQATVAWVGLHALTTPQLDVELAFAQPAPGEEPPLNPVAHVAPGPWLEREHRRLSTLRLARADFSQRHAAGVARAAIALLTGSDLLTQTAAYRNAVGEVLPGSSEAQVVSETAAHIGRGWLDPRDDSEAPADPTRVFGKPSPAGPVIVSPRAFGRPAADAGPGTEAEVMEGEVIEPDSIVVAPPEAPPAASPEPEIVIEPPVRPAR